jgi:hypothetical protein
VGVGAGVGIGVGGSVKNVKMENSTVASVLRAPSVAITLTMWNRASRSTGKSTSGAVCSKVPNCHDSPLSVE